MMNYLLEFQRFTYNYRLLYILVRFFNSIQQATNDPQRPLTWHRLFSSTKYCKLYSACAAHYLTLACALCCPA